MIGRLTLAGFAATCAVIAAASTQADNYGYPDSYGDGSGWGHDRHGYGQRNGNIFYRAYNSYDGDRRDLGYWERPHDRWSGYDCAWTTGCGYYPRRAYGYGSYGYGSSYNYGYAYRRGYDSDRNGRAYGGYGWGHLPQSWGGAYDHDRGTNADYDWTSPRW